MKRNRWLIYVSLLLLPLVVGVILVDLAGTFSFSDAPFAIALALYTVFVLMQRAKSNSTFLITIFFLILMGLSYIPTGPGPVTERIGEWFYLFFLYGLIQYLWETYGK